MPCTVVHERRGPRGSVTEAARVDDGDNFWDKCRRERGRAEIGWTVKVLVPRPLANAMEAFVATVRTELTWTLRDELLKELKWYFNRFRSTASPRALSFEDEEFWRDQAAFAAPHYKQLYRRC